MCGTDDILCADAHRLSARMQGRDGSTGIARGVEVEGFTFVEQPDMIHVYPLLPHWEGQQARKMIMVFISKHLE